ncbi:MAG TPA: diaminopimelate epimerase [Planctomycetaceae bacterium]|nr:diaminopimelate epimerase [Planctomycetaceae bacterium]HRF00902.1 diaminopimelate epimerase [Pirellulaceae bacterium]
MKFTKMHGAGNDYVYVDCFRERFPADPAELARRIADRHTGVGGDGLILICPSDRADARMRMYNADGSESEMCGNGIRCVAKFLYDHGIAAKERLSIETGAGILTLDLEIRAGRAERVKVDMGAPVLEAARIPTLLSAPQAIAVPLEIGDRTFEATCVSMGNPHCVLFVPEATDELVLGYGPRIERDPRFPARVNVEFVEVRSRTELVQRTWERGSGETLACGTGASAVCVAGFLTGRSERRVTIRLRGGDLDLAWDDASGHVFMTGPAVEVFEGVWPD